MSRASNKKPDAVQVDIEKSESNYFHLPKPSYFSWLFLGVFFFFIFFFFFFLLQKTKKDLIDNSAGFIDIFASFSLPNSSPPAFSLKGFSGLQWQE